MESYGKAFVSHNFEKCNVNDVLLHKHAILQKFPEYHFSLEELLLALFGDLLSIIPSRGVYLGEKQRDVPARTKFYDPVLE